VEALPRLNFPHSYCGIRSASSEKMAGVKRTGPRNGSDCISVSLETLYLGKVLALPDPEMVRREPYFTMDPAADPSREPVESHFKQLMAESCAFTSFTLEACSMSQYKSLPDSSEVVNMTLFFQDSKDPGFESRLYCLTGAPFSSHSYVNSNLR